MIRDDPARIATVRHLHEMIASLQKQVAGAQLFPLPRCCALLQLNPPHSIEAKNQKMLIQHHVERRTAQPKFPLQERIVRERKFRVAKIFQKERPV